MAWEREPRAYDNGLANKTFGITLADVFKAAPFFALIVTVYVNQQNFNIMILNSQNQNAQAISAMKDTLVNLNNYLSSSTGKQFKDGRPF